MVVSVLISIVSLSPAILGLLGAKLSHCDRDCGVAHRAHRICYLASYRNSLLSSVVLYPVEEDGRWTSPLSTESETSSPRLAGAGPGRREHWPFLLTVQGTLTSRGAAEESPGGPALGWPVESRA